MGASAAVLRVAELTDAHYGTWDALSASRGIHADVYSTGAWFRSWAAVASAAELGQVRVVTAADGDDLRALLPLSPLGSSGWQSTGAFRYRGSVVTAGEVPEPGTLELLVEQVLRMDARRLLLRRLPLRDPASGELVTALKNAGFSVLLRPVETDHITPAEGGWAEYEQRFHGFARYAQRMVGRTSALWDIAMDTYGTSDEWPVDEGFAIYEGIQRRSWKGPFTSVVLHHRRELLKHAEKNGWARVFILRIADVPAAGHVWFRIGDVAVWLSTAYDQRLASLSPGTVAQWWAHERVFAQPPPALVDLLPGNNDQKQRLTRYRPPLVDVDVTRPRYLPRSSLRGDARRAASALRRRAGGLGSLKPARPRRAVRVRTERIAPGPARTGAAALTPDAALHRYLAVAGAHASTQAMTARWAQDDQWFRIGPLPSALVRLTPGPGERLVKEVIYVDADCSFAAVVGDLAAALGETVVVTRADEHGDLSATPTEEHVCALPWPHRFEAMTSRPVTSATR